jgi:hypothetical protein
VLAEKCVLNVAGFLSQLKKVTPHITGGEGNAVEAAVSAAITRIPQAARLPLQLARRLHRIRCLNFVDAQFGTLRLGFIHENFNLSDCSSFH